MQQHDSAWLFRTVVLMKPAMQACCREQAAVIKHEASKPLNNSLPVM